MLKHLDKRNIKNLIWYALGVAVLFFIFVFLVTANQIGYGVKDECRLAQERYGGDCVKALIATVRDETALPGRRNSAVWALGQMGDEAVLPALREYYTGVIPKREKWNEVLSQYELKKAIKLLDGGANIAAWVWR